MSGNSTHAPPGRKIEQATGGSYYPFIDQDGCCRIICLDVCEDGVAVRQRIRRPSKLHDSGALALRRAAVRRFAKWASTSSSDKSGRVSFNASAPLSETRRHALRCQKEVQEAAPLVSSSGEHDTNRIRCREAHAFKHRRSTIPNFGINTCLD